MKETTEEIVFISGPMTGLPDYNYGEFNRVEDTLTSLGVTTINPAKVGVQPDWSWTDYLRHSLDSIIHNKVTHIIVLEGWTSSKGALLEVRLAQDLGARVMTLSEYLLHLGLTYKE